jgi:hypothetical protein
MVVVPIARMASVVHLGVAGEGVVVIVLLCLLGLVALQGKYFREI